MEIYLAPLLDNWLNSLRSSSLVLSEISEATEARIRKIRHFKDVSIRLTWKNCTLQATVLTWVCSIHIQGCLFISLFEQTFLLNFLRAKIKNFRSQDLGVFSSDGSRQTVSSLAPRRPFRSASVAIFVDITLWVFCFTVTEIHTSSVVHVHLNSALNKIRKLLSASLLYADNRETCWLSLVGCLNWDLQRVMA